MHTEKETLVPVPTRARRSTAKALGRLARQQRPKMTVSQYVRQILERHVEQQQESAA